MSRLMSRVTESRAAPRTGTSPSRRRGASLWPGHTITAGYWPPLARDTAQLSLSKWHNTTQHIVTRHANTPHILPPLVRDMSQDWQHCAGACSASSIIMIVISSVLETQPGVAEISIIPPKLIKASIKEFGFCIQSHSIQLFNYMLSVPSVDKIKTMVIFIVRG